jgi:hypothetical protein
VRSSSGPQGKCSQDQCGSLFGEIVDMRMREI